jgi:hypothetical protein
MNQSISDWRRGSRARLLTTVSAIALIVSVYGAEPVIAAEESGEPPLWIELGWHADHVYDSKDGFALPLGNLIPQTGITGPLVGGLNLSHSYGDDGKITIRPDGTNWVFSASVTYGRSHGSATVSQTQGIPTTSFVTLHTSLPAKARHRTVYHTVAQHSRDVSATTASAENHFVIDFEAGKDVGLGMFDRSGISTFGAGVRFAQLNSALNVEKFNADPDVHFEYYHATKVAYAYISGVFQAVPRYVYGYSQVWHSIAGNPHSSHDFNGLGPSVYWDASVPLLGNPKQVGEILIDWGVNAAILFGKQKNKVQHQTVGGEFCVGRYCQGLRTEYRNTSQIETVKNVTVPNLGGFVGISYRRLDFKASVGYRGDFFFRAVDTGISGQSASTRGFQGPYASISIGIGD